MAYVPVDVYLVDTSPQANPIVGVVVRVYSQNGAMFFTQVSTDTNGHAGFLLPDSTTYQLRFYKFGVGFQNPWYMQVQPSPAVNSFTVSAELVTPPVPADARLCTAFGTFRRPDGSAAPYLDIQFIPKFKPLILDGSALLVERATVRTDCNGYVELNLIRGGQYDVTIQGLEDMQRYVNVPDAPNWNIADLLFPVVSQITFDPPGPLTVGVGQQIQVTPTVYTSDGNEDTCGAYDVAWSSDNPQVMGLNIAGGILTLNGLSAGTANIIAVRLDQTIVTIPPTPIQGIPMPVTVS